MIQPTRIRVLIGLLAAAVTLPVLAVGTSNWTHTNEADFKNGTFDNVVVTNFGDLKLSRAVKTLLEQDPQVSEVNALAEGADGTIYAGTGPHGTLLSIKGDAVTTLATLEDATNLFSLTVDAKGRLLIGTGGASGKIYRLDKPSEKDAKPKEIFAAEGVQYIWAMRETSDGNVYAATGPNGQLFEIKPDGSNRVVLDSDENNLTALVSDGKDFLYVGTDPNGLVYRVNRKTGESFVLYDAPEAEISALVIDGAGNIYASTAEAKEGGNPAPGAPGAENGGRPEGGESGAPITSEPPKSPQPPALPDPTPGQPKPIPKQIAPAAPAPHAFRGNSARFAPRREPADSLLGTIARAGGTTFYMADTTIPKPIVEGDAPGHPPKQPPKSPTPPPAPAPAPPPTPNPNPTPGPATTPSPLPPQVGHQPTVNAVPPESRPEGNAIYQIDRDGFVTEIFRQNLLILGMAESQGGLLVATGGEGQVYHVSPATEETVVLAKVEPKDVMCLLPAKDGRVYVGTANVGSLAAMSSGFATKGTFTSPVLDAGQISRFGKMRLNGSLGRETGLSVSFRSGNVQDAAEKGWSSWSDEAPAVEYLAVPSPAARFLQYRLTMTSKEGRDTPVVQDVNVAYQVPNLPPVVKSVKVMPLPDAAAPEGEAARIPVSRRQGIAWEASDPNNDALQYSIYFRRDDGAWILLKEKLTEFTYEWDTRAVADGRYEIRVVASDAMANVPGKGKTAARVSDPVVVDNTPPVIGDVKWAQKGADVRVEFRVVDRSGVVAASDYAVDSSRDWQAILPSDSIWDSPEETASFTVAGLAPGAHQVTLRATDAKGNQAYENVSVTVHGPAAAAK